MDDYQSPVSQKIFPIASDYISPTNFTSSEKSYNWIVMTAICCNQCFHTIASTDEPAAKLWLDLCAYFVKLEGNFKLRENRVPGTIKHFRNLEKLGFISTADGLDAVTVRVNGYDVIEVDEQQICLDTFCLDREKHQSEWL